MSENSDAVVCGFCKKGRLTMKMEEIAFRQWSDKGHIQCRVEILTGTCDSCGAKSLPEDCDAIFDAAFQREYDKLP